MKKLNPALLLRAKKTLKLMLKFGKDVDLNCTDLWDSEDLDIFLETYEEHYRLAMKKALEKNSLETRKIDEKILIGMGK